MENEKLLALASVMLTGITTLYEGLIRHRQFDRSEVEYVADDLANAIRRSELPPHVIDKLGLMLEDMITSLELECLATDPHGE